jgi:tripartite-type tricarboxylate transporter receptor subunit TctC
MSILARVFVALGIVVGLAWQPASAQPLSGRTIRIIVPFAAGGTGDIIARLLGEHTGPGGPTVLVENRPGAGTIIGTDLVARSPADGNTLALIANSFIINPSLRPNLAFNPLTSFEPVCLLTDSPQLIVVNSESPYRTLADLVAAARAKPGDLTYATVGPATTQHIAFETFKRAAGIQLTYVPYGGGAPAASALLGGHVTVVLQNYSELMEYVRAGKLRVLAVTTRARLADLPDVPTVIESGYPGYEAAAWFGIVAPAKTPKETLDALARMFTAGLQVPKVKDNLQSQQGMRLIGICAAEFGAFMRRQYDFYAEAVRAANIKAE